MVGHHHVAAVMLKFPEEEMGGAAGADDEDTLAVIGKKREELLVEEGLTVGATVGDENMAWQESGVVGGVSSSDLSITPLLQIQEHRLPDGHCQS